MGESVPLTDSKYIENGSNNQLPVWTVQFHLEGIKSIQKVETNCVAYKGTKFYEIQVKEFSPLTLVLTTYMDLTCNKTIFNAM